MKFYDRTGKKHTTIFGAVANNLLSTFDKTLTKKARGYREAGEDRYDETPGAYTGHSGVNNPIVVPYVNAEESDDCGTVATASITAEAASIETPEPASPAQKISIDYAHQRIILEDADGNIITTSPIDEKLMRGTIDQTLLDALYPDGKVPEDVKMNIQSTPAAPKTVILGADGMPFPPAGDFTPSDGGACG